jgi:hypothetical protein
MLALNGTLMSITESGDWWVKFVVRRVPVTTEKPHGLDYSLTLHGPGNARYVGYDNAHSITVGSGPGARKPVAQDHRHRLKSVKPYEYQDAATLLADFWQEVDTVLREEGAAP